MTVDAALHGANRKAKRAGDSQWVDRVARVGFAARGVLYLTVAFLAASIALGQSGQSADKQGAVRALAETSLGKVLLVVLVIGFAGLALWQVTEALWGKRQEHNDAKRAGKRGLSAGRVVVYLVLSGSAASVLLSGNDAKASSGDQKEHTWTARVLEVSGGRLLVGLVGLVIMAIGGCLVVSGVRQKFEQHLNTRAMPSGLWPLARIVGVLGYGARGVVAALAGLLLVKAAVDYDPQEAKGVDGTLRTIAEQPYGKALLLLAAAGLAAFGLFSFVEARYRRF